MSMKPADAPLPWRKTLRQERRNPRHDRGPKRRTNEQVAA